MNKRIINKLKQQYDNGEILHLSQQDYIKYVKGIRKDIREYYITSGQKFQYRGKHIKII